MKFLFVVGPPGVGHMMFYSLMKDILDEKKAVSAKILLQPGSSFKDSPELNKMLSNIWNPRVHTLPRVDYEKTKNSVRTEVKKLSDSGCNHFLATHTFPYGHPYPGNRPNLVELFDFIGDISDIKLLPLYRDPVAVTWSAVRRGFIDDVMKQARIVENNFIYIVEQLKQCPKDNYEIFTYEKFFTDYDYYINIISDFWSLNKDTFIKDIRIPAVTPEEERNRLQEFFTEERVSQWKFLYENSN